MHVDLEEVDSRVLGQAVLTLRNFDPAADFAAFEKEYVANHRPRYVACKVPVDQLRSIQALEELGFRFVEVQIGGVAILRKQRDVSSYPYRFERVTTEKVLDEVLDIAGASFDTDRFSNDSELGAGFSGRRYREYVRKSFRELDEAVYRLFDPADGKTLCFKTHKVLNNREVYSLLTAARPDLKGSGLGMLMDWYYDNQLLADGITRIRTAISAAHPIMVRHLVSGGAMKVETIQAVVRKLYPIAPRDG